MPYGDCGIVYVYDAAGNRTKRVYFCNDNSAPYPSKQLPYAAQTPKGQPAITKSEIPNKKEEETFNAKESTDHIEVQQVDALYPNPTTVYFI